MTAAVRVAQLWAENLLGVLARSRTLYEELDWLVGRGKRDRALAILPLCYQQPIKNHVDAYLRVWTYLRGYATPAESTRFFRLLQARDQAINRHLYGLVLRHRLWYLHNSRLFLDNPCPVRLWTAERGETVLVTMERSGDVVRPWPDVAGELRRAEGAELAARALGLLVLLQVGEQLFWNPKLEGLPGAIDLVTRLGRAGVRVSPGLRSIAAEG